MSRALLAALLFGATAPAAKVLLAGISPVLLAALFYLGSGVALATTRLFSPRPGGAAFRRDDVPWLAGAIVSGGIVAPLALLWGLERVSASAASLVLNLEAVLTAVLAAWIFREHVGVRTVSALVLVTAGSAALLGGPGKAEAAGLAAVAFACLGWALDNNLTREIAHADARAVAMWKGIVAGSVNATLAWVSGAAFPDASRAVAALCVGAIGYGVSLTLFVQALRELGAARTGAYFATAPFLGSALGIFLLGEPLTAELVLAAVAMAAGVSIMVGEKHLHGHRHRTMEHAHRHVHDEHHSHSHEGGEGPEPHVHMHRHEELVHAHPHAPDIHHRHRHEPGSDPQ